MYKMPNHTKSLRALNVMIDMIYLDIKCNTCDPVDGNKAQSF